ncbi:MAG: dihydrolipoyl dehydrogenase [Flavobacteriales bacterium]|nr:dihydrolipoyl dehydrogenase [Flavobacteriales bacterium]
MNYDIIIIGSGPGGYVAAIRASQLGLKTAVVERENLGGICLNWGCIPTKALLKSAQVYDYLKHAGDYGIKIKEVEVDFEKIIGRSRQVAESMSKGVQFLMKKNNIDVIWGSGKILSAGKVEVTAADKTKQTLQTKHIIIATGARSRQLPHIKQDGKKVIGYREALTLPKQPQSMLVIGSGAIGTEFSYFYHTLGTKVTMVEFMPQIMPFEDEETSKTMEKVFKKQGLNIMVNSSVEKVDTSGEGCKVLIKTPKGEETVTCDIVLSAVGVEANIEGIGLESVGIKTEKGKILTDTFYQTNIQGIYAIGDVIPGPALAHLASHEGIVCVEKIAGKNPDPIDYKNIPACTYTQPEVASVGLTEKKAKEEGYEIKVGKFPFTASGKAKAAGHADGYVKLIFDAQYGELLGAHMIGANVTEMIAEIVVLRKLETTGHEIISSIHPHPTMSEAVMEAAAAAYGEVIHL